MAITIKVEPQKFVPVYNEVITVLDSTNKAEPKFQYVIDINIDGVFSSRIKVQSNPDGFGIVNLQKHIEGFVSSSLDLADKEAFKKIADSYIKYDVTLSEEYVLTTSFTSVSDNGGFCQYNYAAPHNFVADDFVTVSGSSVPAYDGVQEVTSIPNPSAIVTTEIFSATATGDTVLSNGTTTVIPDAAVFTGTKYALNNVLNWLDVPNWDASDYNIEAGTSPLGILLTNVPDVMTTRLDDRFTFNFYNDFTVEEAWSLKVVSDNRGEFYFDNAFETADDTSRFLSVGVGAFDISNAPLGAGLQSTLPVIDGDTKSYTVELVDGGRLSSSKQYTFNVDQRCNDFTGYRLMYLNKAGGFSTFNFELQSSKTVSVKKTNYKKGFGSYNDSTVSYGYESSAKGDVRLDTDIKESYSVHSNYVSEAVGDLIEDLLVSPEVYHLSDNTTTFDTPVSIINATDNGGLLEIETGAPHDVNVGDTVLLDDFSNIAYDREFTVQEVVSATAYTIDKSTESLPFVGGGETMAKQIFLADGVLRAIEVETSSYKIKKRAIDNVINYQLKFRYSNKNTVQR